MKIDFNSKQNFKGYDAAPLKALFMQRNWRDPFYWELDEISKQENLEIKPTRDIVKWGQDHRTIINKKNKPHILASFLSGQESLDSIKEKYSMSGELSPYFVEGGNCFLGKYFNGEKWMLIGEEDIVLPDSKAKIGKEYGVKKKNVFTIPQQYYHLDMFIRPIGYPFVLVDNPQLVKEKYKELNKNGEFDELIREFNKFEKSRKENYQNPKKTVSALKKAGFIPIEIAGNYGSGINFINAVVNKHSNGSISYITNSSKTYDGIATKLQEEFEKDLKAKAPDIDKIYFISGPLQKNANFMMDQLSMFGGGIHCLTTEEVNFEAWG